MNKAFNIKNIINIYTPNYENVLEYGNLYPSVSKECLTALSAFHEDFNDIKSSYLNDILNDDSFENVSKSFENYVTNISSLIKKYKSQAKALCTNFENSVKRNLAVVTTKNIDEVRKFDFQMTINGFNFTINDYIPVLNMLTIFNDEFLKINSDVANGDDIKDSFSNRYDECLSEISNGKYDKIRAAVLGQSGSISEREFSGILFRIFRNDKADIESIIIDNEKINNMVNHIMNVQSVINDAWAFEKKLEYQLQEIEKKLIHLSTSAKKKVVSNYTTINVDNDFAIMNKKESLTKDNIGISNMFMDLKIKEVITLVDIYMIALSYKFDAIKDSYEQDANTILRLLSTKGWR